MQANYDPPEWGFRVPVGVAVGMHVAPLKPVLVFVIVYLDLVVDMAMRMPQIILDVCRDTCSVVEHGGRRFIPAAASNAEGQTEQKVNRVFHGGVYCLIKLEA